MKKISHDHGSSAVTYLTVSLPVFEADHVSGYLGGDDRERSSVQFNIHRDPGSSPSRWENRE